LKAGICIYIILRTVNVVRFFDDLLDHTLVKFFIGSSLIGIGCAYFSFTIWYKEELLDVLKLMCLYTAINGLVSLVWFFLRVSWYRGWNKAILEHETLVNKTIPEMKEQLYRRKLHDLNTEYEMLIGEKHLIQK